MFEAIVPHLYLSFAHGIIAEGLLNLLDALSPGFWQNLMQYLFLLHSVILCEKKNPTSVHHTSVH